MIPASVSLLAFTITMTRIARSLGHRGGPGRIPGLALAPLCFHDERCGPKSTRRTENLLGHEPHQCQRVTVGISKLPELELALVGALHHGCWPHEVHAALLQLGAQR